ncbi:RNA polymerase sigma factor [Brucella pseudogrignonensis]|jgi:RNA polymerase sigma-70 factor (ECF subfamily)|uniref:RNA polymerase sigma factor n=2 Tax=Brucella TaxID=234 RepID=A0A656Z7W1_BRUAN|nr:sigma-70 family RNA polymerase sigma factor [Brucella pseudogrignonensis]EMG51534.1 ECF subfamily RNA polymerase sigma-24 factor [Ochrobactrum sp. CDB2]KYB45735.1 RNA polymerase subunit sigma [Brucella anthropi]MBK0022617.1 sigma-70 family RNA polymerase sigma factor [Ochrobactrum sp. S45]MBK0044632.1 sigma-70 family RNA polymerase sigma factor [Ochrobactrum sp. S46]MBO1026624.1 sigma-70 family RNA polymerase sigma factor [Ochrobactrum sp. SD129]
MLSRSPNHNASDPVLEPDQLVAMIPALRAFARKFYREREDVEDLVQETLVKAIANRSKYVPYAPLKSWLFTIMRNTFCTRIRIQTREAPGLNDCISQDMVVKPSQQYALEAHEVQLALETLSDKYQQVLALVVFEGKSYQRTAELCDCSVGTVKSRLHRARHQLHMIVDG